MLCVVIRTLRILRITGVGLNVLVDHYLAYCRCETMGFLAVSYG